MKSTSNYTGEFDSALAPMTIENTFNSLTTRITDEGCFVQFVISKDGKEDVYHLEIDELLKRIEWLQKASGIICRGPNDH